MLAAGEKIGSKVAGYIPFVGKPLSKALAVASKATDMAANKIHAKMPGNLGKGMDAMNQMEKYTGFL